jgi:hypothetical protein
MTATEIIEKYEVPQELHEAIFEAYTAGAEALMIKQLENLTAQAYKENSDAMARLTKRIKEL